MWLLIIVIIIELMSCISLLLNILFRDLQLLHFGWTTSMSLTFMSQTSPGRLCGQVPPIGRRWSFTGPTCCWSSPAVIIVHRLSNSSGLRTGRVSGISPCFAVQLHHLLYLSDSVVMPFVCPRSGFQVQVQKSLWVWRGSFQSEVQAGNGF